MNGLLKLLAKAGDPAQVSVVSDRSIHLGHGRLLARGSLRGRHVVAFVLASAFVTFYYWFNVVGGFYELGEYPSESPIRVFMPTLEGVALCALIAWYDRSFTGLRGRLSDAVVKIGEYSYSIYLLHFFFVFGLAQYIDEHLI